MSKSTSSAMFWCEILPAMHATAFLKIGLNCSCLFNYSHHHNASNENLQQYDLAEQSESSAKCYERTGEFLIQTFSALILLVDDMKPAKKSAVFINNPQGFFGRPMGNTA